MMLNIENAKIEVTERNPSTESAKNILENMDAILKELANELDNIESVIFGARPFDEPKETSDDSMLETLNRQRNVAEAILHTAMHIREGLW